MMISPDALVESNDLLPVKPNRQLSRRVMSLVLDDHDDDDEDEDDEIEMDPNSAYGWISVGSHNLNLSLAYQRAVTANACPKIREDAEEEASASTMKSRRFLRKQKSSPEIRRKQHSSTADEERSKHIARHRQMCQRLNIFKTGWPRLPSKEERHRTRESPTVQPTERGNNKGGTSLSWAANKSMGWDAETTKHWLDETDHSSRFGDSTESSGRDIPLAAPQRQRSIPKRILSRSNSSWRSYLPSKLLEGMSSRPSTSSSKRAQHR